MSGILNYGVISTASIARSQHIPAASESENSRIVAISSRDSETARGAAADLGIDTAYGSYDELLTDYRIDAIINPLPNSLHEEWSIRAAEAGKHILCEKPLAPTPDECQRMIDAAHANDVLLYEGFTQHFNPLMSDIHSLIDDGSLGEVNYVRSELTYTLANWETDVRGLKDLDGGALLDAGCYAVNNVRTLMGSEPLEVAAQQRVHAGNQVDALFTGTLKFSDDRLAYICTGMQQPFRCMLEVVGTNGLVRTENFFTATELTVTVAGETSVRTYDSVNRFALQMTHFSDCVLNGKSLRKSAEDGKANAATLVALKQSAQTGRVVAV
ncbi:MAG: hypothetical protein CME19_10730 [Gemmatimonadetes bacterium]|nr:hypothetical protein [Gemmatimonadota bacterium]|tara:strand:+ start:1213 stop:2193 length:981 start_codon:yes stop_codon:yes gene_type:complete